MTMYIITNVVIILAVLIGWVYCLKNKYTGFKKYKTILISVSIASIAVVITFIIMDTCLYSHISTLTIALTAIDIIYVLLILAIVWIIYLIVYSINKKVKTK